MLYAGQEYFNNEDALYSGPDNFLHTNVFTNKLLDFTIKIWGNGRHSGAVAGTADSQQEGPGFVSSLRPFCVCMFSLCPHGYSG